MTTTSKALGAVLLAVVGLAVSGCDEYRIETVLYSDGSVDRAIYQPAEDTPKDARKSDRWKQVTFAPAPDKAAKEGWSGLIRDLPLKAPDRDRPYLAAWARFPSPDRIPDHVEFKAPEGSKVPSGKLVRRYQRNDYVFVVEHRWREALTDVVTLADLRQAREELADLLLQVGEDSFQEAVGPNYDSRELFKWLRSEGKAMFAEITEARFIQYAARKGQGGDDAFKDELAAILARHGLALKAQGQWLDDKGTEEALEKFCVAQLVRGVRDRKSGAAVDPATAATWLREMVKRNDKESEKNRFEKAAAKVIDRKYQGQAALQRRLQALQVRVLGLYRGSLILPAPQSHAFHYTLMMPGKVVECNGQILTDNRARWQFGAEDAYPLGYEMSCSSLEAQPQNQRELLKGQPLADREGMLDYVKAVAGNDKLLAALEECRKQKSMAPLYELRKQQIELDRLLKLLKLPADGKGP
jgi:hypothetical protein